MPTNRTAFATLALTVATASLPWSAAQAATRVEFWHAFSGNNGEAVAELAASFNESQDDYELVPVYTGKYDEGTTKLQAAQTASW